jgi:hypothetical protein
MASGQQIKTLTHPEKTKKKRVTGSSDLLSISKSILFFLPKTHSFVTPKKVLAGKKKDISKSF